MQKVLNIISVLSFLLVLSISGIGIFGYLYLTNEENQEKIKKQLMEEVKKTIPLPAGISGPAIPTQSEGKKEGFSIPKF